MQASRALASNTQCRAVRTLCSAPSGAKPPRRAGRRALLGAGAAAVLLGAPPRSRASSWQSAAGLEYRDEKVGDGEEAAAGDTVKILYSAHALDNASDPEALGTVFDPYGSAGSSSAKGYKVTLGGSDSDLSIMHGWELSILGGEGLPPMRAGGRRVVRLPPSLAYGAEGHLCKRNIKTACEVPPNTAVQIETVLLGRAY